MTFLEHCKTYLYQPTENPTKIPILIKNLNVSFIEKWSCFAIWRKMLCWVKYPINKEAENQHKKGFSRFFGKYPSRQILVLRSSWGLPSIISPELLLNILSFREHPLGTSWSDVPRTSQLIVSEMSWINLLETCFWKRCRDVPQRTFRRTLKVVVGSSVTCHQISFYFFPKLNAILRGKFKNQSSIYDAAFL